jgi:hypothetical protein
MKTGALDAGQVAHGAIRDVSDAPQRAADLGVDFAEQRAESRPFIHVFENDHARCGDGRQVFPPIQPVVVPIPRCGSRHSANPAGGGIAHPGRHRWSTGIARKYW